MLRLNYQVPGTPPATLLSRKDVPDDSSSLTLFVYDKANVQEVELKSLDELDQHFDPKKVNWLNICGVANSAKLEKLSQRFGLHPLALEDVTNTSQRPKLEPYDDHLFIVSEMLYFDEEQKLNAEQISLFLGPNFVITLQEKSGEDWFEIIRKRLRNGKGNLRSMRSDYLTYAILDAIVDHFFPILEAIGDHLNTSEEELLQNPNRQSLHAIFRIQRLLLQSRRAAWPHREIFNSLLRDDSELIHPETHVFLRDCYDHTTQIIDMVETYRDLAASLMDLHFASLDSRTNDIMRVLTLVSVFFLPLTFLAGVYGMNFDTESKWNMPELSWKFGYEYFWLFCLLISTFMFWYFKRRKWL
ncbi:MAG: magnesium/cobalt transporter CorA [Chthoniobacterales bacterium]